MSPLEQKVQELERKIAQLESVENNAFIANLERRLNFLSSTFSLSDATDGPDETPATGEVLKWDGDRYNPAPDIDT